MGDNTSPSRMKRRLRLNDQMQWMQSHGTTTYPAHKQRVEDAKKIQMLMSGLKMSDNPRDELVTNMLFASKDPQRAVEASGSDMWSCHSSLNSYTRILADEQVKTKSKVESKVFNSTNSGSGHVSVSDVENENKHYLPHAMNVIDSEMGDREKMGLNPSTLLTEHRRRVIFDALMDCSDEPGSRPGSRAAVGGAQTGSMRNRLSSDNTASALSAGSAPNTQRGSAPNTQRGSAPNTQRSNISNTQRGRAVSVASSLGRSSISRTSTRSSRCSDSSTKSNAKALAARKASRERSKLKVGLYLQEKHPHLLTDNDHKLISAAEKRSHNGSRAGTADSDSCDSSYSDGDSSYDPRHFAGLQSAMQSQVASRVPSRSNSVSGTGAGKIPSSIVFKGGGSLAGSSDTSGQQKLHGNSKSAAAAVARLPKMPEVRSGNISAVNSPAISPRAAIKKFYSGTVAPMPLQGSPSVNRRGPGHHGGAQNTTAQNIQRKQESDAAAAAVSALASLRGTPVTEYGMDTPTGAGAAAGGAAGVTSSLMMGAAGSPSEPVRSSSPPIAGGKIVFGAAAARATAIIAAADELKSRAGSIFGALHKEKVAAENEEAERVSTSDAAELQAKFDREAAQRALKTLTHDADGKPLAHLVADSTAPPSHRSSQGEHPGHGHGRHHHHHHQHDPHDHPHKSNAPNAYEVAKSHVHGPSYDHNHSHEHSHGLGDVHGPASSSKSSKHHPPNEPHLQHANDGATSGRTSGRASKGHGHEHEKGDVDGHHVQHVPVRLQNSLQQGSKASSTYEMPAGKGQFRPMWDNYEIMRVRWSYVRPQTHELLGDEEMAIPTTFDRSVVLPPTSAAAGAGAGAGVGVGNNGSTVGGGRETGGGIAGAMAQAASRVGFVGETAFGQESSFVSNTINAAHTSRPNSPVYGYAGPQTAAIAATKTLNAGATKLRGNVQDIRRFERAHSRHADKLHRVSSHSQVMEAKLVAAKEVERERPYHYVADTGLHGSTTSANTPGGGHSKNAKEVTQIGSRGSLNSGHIKYANYESNSAAAVKQHAEETGLTSHPYYKTHSSCLLSPVRSPPKIPHHVKLGANRPVSTSSLNVAAMRYKKRGGMSQTTGVVSVPTYTRDSAFPRLV